MAYQSTETKVWFDKPAYDAAECQHFEKLAKVRKPGKFSFDFYLPKKFRPTEVADAQCLDKHVFASAECQYYQNRSKLLNNGVSKRGVAESELKSKRAVSGKKTSNKESDKRAVDRKDATTIVSHKIPVVHAACERNVMTLPSIPTDSGVPVCDPVNVPATPVTGKCSKLKEVKEKRNKADKKGRERKLANKEETKGSPNTSLGKTSLAGEVAKARQHIKNSLQSVGSMNQIIGDQSCTDNLGEKMARFEQTSLKFYQKLDVIAASVKNLEVRMKALEDLRTTDGTLVAKAKTVTSQVAANLAKDKAAVDELQKKDDDEDDGVDLFASDEEEEESEEAKKLKEARLSAYAAKKSKKPALIAKSNIILDVKPWDDETDMKKLEAAVREVKCDGLLWGASKLVPLAYGIHKLQISCVVEDEKVSIDWLQETIEGNEDFVQSVDIAAFNKV